MNKKLRRLALLVLTLCFAGSMALLVNADTLAEDEELIGSAWCENCQAETVHLMKGYVHQTCTEPGYSGDIYCSVCRTLLQEGLEKEPRHTFEYEGAQFSYVWTESNGVISMTGTLKCLYCDEVMSESYSCGYDGSDVISYTIVRPATCVQNEVRQYSIPNAAVDLPSFDFEIPDSKLSSDSKHSYTAEYIWSATSNGATLKQKNVCSVCGDSYEDIVSSEHILSEEFQEPEGKNEGHYIVKKTHYYLDSDKTVKYEYVEKLGLYDHLTTTPQYVWSGEYGNVTLTRNGTCGYCSVTFSEEIPSEKISVANTEIATCTSNGVYTYTYFCYDNNEDTYYSVEAPDTMLEHADEKHYIWDWEWNGEGYDVSLTINHHCYMCGGLEREPIDQSLVANEVIPATCKKNQTVRYYYTKEPEHFKELEIPGTQLSHAVDEDKLSGYEWVGAYINGNVTLKATGICKDCGESFDYYFPYDSISSEQLSTETCQKNAQMRYWLEGHPEIPEHVVDIPNSTVNHSNSYNNGEFVWSYDSSSGRASVKFVAKCQWCGTDIEEVYDSSLIQSNEYEHATCIRNKKIRFWAYTDPNSGFTIPDFIVEIPESKGDHEYGFPHGTWDVSADSASVTINYQCENCDHTYSNIISSEFITTVTDAEATCENNKRIHYLYTGDLYFVGNDVSETIEVPDTKLGHEYVASVKNWNSTESWNYYFKDEAADWVKVTGVNIYCNNGDVSTLIPADETFYDVEYQVETCQEEGHWVIPSFTVTYDGEEITVPSTTVTRPKMFCEWDQKTLVGYVEPTCTTPGWSGDACCMWCGKVLQPSQELEPEHDIDDGDAQFFWDGFGEAVSLRMEIACKGDGCDYIYKDECPTDLIGFEVVREATCQQNEKIRYWLVNDPECEIVPEYVVEIQDSKLEHELVWRRCYSVNFTSETSARIEMYPSLVCDICDKTFDNSLRNDPAVVETVSAKRPTCKENGYYELPDVEKTWTIHKEDGTTEEMTFSWKGFTGIEIAERQYHVPSSGRVGVMEATCTTAGYTGDLYCTECGELIEAGKTVTSLGHDYNRYNINNYATCTSDGTATAYCSRCGDMDTITLTTANGHVSTVTNAKAATCMSEGYTGDSVCSVCGKILARGKTIAVTDHKAVRVNAKAATCTAEGYTGDTVCGMCGKSMSQGEAIAATGHSFTAVDEDYSICTGCGAEQGTPRLTVVEDVVVEQPVNAPAASLVVRTTAAPVTESSATAVESNEPKILTIEYIPEVVIEAAEADQQEEGELTIQLPAEQVEGYVLYLVQEDGTKIKVPVVFEDGKAVIKLNHKLNFRSNWVIRMERAEQA